jgi:hypothetical protein
MRTSQSLAHDMQALVFLTQGLLDGWMRRSLALGAAMLRPVN